MFFANISIVNVLPKWEKFGITKQTLKPFWLIAEINVYTEQAFIIWTQIFKLPKYVSCMKLFIS